LSPLAEEERATQKVKRTDDLKLEVDHNMEKLVEKEVKAYIDSKGNKKEPIENSTVGAS
jgi:hypothetical protein